MKVLYSSPVSTDFRFFSSHSLVGATYLRGKLNSMAIHFTTTWSACKFHYVNRALLNRFHGCRIFLLTGAKFFDENGDAKNRFFESEEVCNYLLDYFAL